MSERLSIARGVRAIAKKKIVKTRTYSSWRQTKNLTLEGQEESLTVAIC